MSAPSHPRLDVLHPIVASLEAAARVTAKSARKLSRQNRRRSGTTLHPGPDTPLWNELAAACLARLTRFGDKARLARVLGLSRQRLHELLVARTACPDAERALGLVEWLATERRAEAARKVSPNK